MIKKVYRTKFTKKANLSFSRIKRLDYNLYRPGYKIGKMAWDFHKGDDDFNPSVPHGHSGQYKLDIVTGDVYDTRTNKIIGKVKEKELLKLKQDQQFVIFAKEVIKLYKENHPNIDIKTPEWINESKVSCFAKSYPVYKRSKDIFRYHLITEIKE
ncbi:MAG: hypothetical protein PUB89_09540 [Oscillospiraceae bacterium]|nr:hypothetical protein [Oscillospiraceae bacterium]